MDFNMNTQLAITIPQKMANASTQAARHLGICRTEFIRQAIAHELALLKKKGELEGSTRGWSITKQ